MAENSNRFQLGQAVDCQEVDVANKKEAYVMTDSQVKVTISPDGMGTEGTDVENISRETEKNKVFRESAEIQVVQTFESLDAAAQAITDFEESTTSNFIVLEKQKNFGNEGFRPSSKVSIHWHGPQVRNVCLLEYTGVPFIIAGRKVLCCHLGQDLCLPQKKRYIQATDQKKTADHGYIKSRKIIQSTKKMDCPAKIYVYHIIRYPDFQITRNTAWHKRMVSKKMNQEITKDNKVLHSYVVQFPKLSEHGNHPIAGELQVKRFWYHVRTQPVRRIYGPLQNLRNVFQRHTRPLILHGYWDNKTQS
ncbi:uncharacterized protein ACNLHF_016233 [Anomaloglossus baeobatrachus]|uniref:uncharacterized protein LOC142304234 n=1 Tax=Anomaloglossus baeobatrachus TaxID=238106 RepID=UPI003F509227